VLRCHLGLEIPSGDLGLRIGGETRVWQPGKCLVFDDTAEHEAWNHTDADRVVLIVTFERRAIRER
jgi:beta-hydroxylase